MKAWRKLYRWLKRAAGTMLALVVLIGAPVGMLFYSQTKHDAPEKDQSKKQSAPAVRATPAVRTDLARGIELIAPARSFWDVQVVSQVPATVINVAADVGDEVAEGSTLVELGANIVCARIRDAEATLSVATAEIERAQSLLKDGAGSQRRVQEAEAAETKAKSSLAVLQQELKEYTVRVPASDADRRWTIIDRRVVTGDFAQQNQVLFQLSDLATIRVLVNTPEREVRWLREGTLATVKFDALPGEVFDGKIARIWPAAREGTYTIPVEVHVSNLESRIRPGMLARVRLNLQRHAGVAAVPVEALLDDRDDFGAVVVVGAEGMAQHRQVKLGLRSGGLVEVIEGVEEGERVVTVGAANTKNGQAVTVLEARSQGGVTP